MLSSIYFQFFKKQYDLIKEEYFFFFSLLLYCVSQILPLFYKVNFSFYLFLLSGIFCLLSIVFRFLGLFFSFSIFFIVFYFYVTKCGFSFFEILWLEGCLVSSCLSLLILLLGLDNLSKKRKMQDSEVQKKIDLLQKEKYTYLKDIQKLELINIKTADFCLALENKNQKDREEFSQILEEKTFLEKQVNLLSDQKLFWISNYDSLHEKFLKAAQFNEKNSNKLIFELKESREDFENLQNQYNELKKNFYLLDLKYKELLQELNDKKFEKQYMDNNSMSNSLESSSNSLDMNLELPRIQGLYNQLRNQFEDKKHQLNLTRKQLFKLEEIVISQKREQEFLLKENDVDLVDVLNLEEKILSLEQEVIYLEELVSHILFE